MHRRGRRRSLQLSPGRRHAEAGSRRPDSSRTAFTGRQRSSTRRSTGTTRTWQRPPRRASWSCTSCTSERSRRAARSTAARRRLADLRALGITAVELMPVADFAGSRNWGYDGVALFAPSRSYGRPDRLRRAGRRRASDRARGHPRRRLQPPRVRKGPICPPSIRRTSPTGTRRRGDAAINLDGPGSSAVRRFIIDNAVHWLREYHLDGLRLDATHALHRRGRRSSSPRAGCARPTRRALARRAPRRGSQKPRVRSFEPPDEGGWGFDGVWADDFHHIMRRLVAGDAHGYYRDYEGTTEELAATLRQGWFYTGQQSVHRNRNRGTDASRVPMQRTIVCLQNHDQVGNRATGERLHHQIDAASWRAASVVLLTAPMTPLIFMGQEWAASTPFLYFTDLDPWLGRSVTEGRRREFQDFPGFDPARDCRRSASAWRPSRPAGFGGRNERHRAHAASLALYTSAAGVAAPTTRRSARSQRRRRRSVAGGRERSRDPAIGGDRHVSGVAQLRGAGDVRYGEYVPDGRCRYDVVLSSEDPQFALDPAADLEIDADATSRFTRPGAVVLRLAGRCGHDTCPDQHVPAAGAPRFLPDRGPRHRPVPVAVWGSATSTRRRTSPPSLGARTATTSATTTRSIPEVGGREAHTAFAAARRRARHGARRGLRAEPHGHRHEHQRLVARRARERTGRSRRHRSSTWTGRRSSRSCTAKLLLPILGDQYGQVLERGELQLAFRDGALVLRVRSTRAADQSEAGAACVPRRRRTARSDTLGPDHPQPARVPQHRLLAREHAAVYGVTSRTAWPSANARRKSRAVGWRRLALESPEVARHIEAADRRCSTASLDSPRASMRFTSCSRRRRIGWRTGERRRTRSTTAASSTSTRSPACGSRCRRSSKRRTRCWRS